MLMNFGFFGIQYSFGMQQTAVNPVYQFLGADPASLPILNMAGPITGLFIQPLIGAVSDRTWSPRWGRRKPFFLLGALGCSICLFLFPFVAAVWMAVILLWLLDASNNTAMEPFRAFIADKLPEKQLAKGFLTQSFFTGLGITLANLSLWVFQQLITSSTSAGIPYWVVGSFMLGSVCSIGSVLVTVLSTKEIPPTKAEVERLKAEKKGLKGTLTEIWQALKDMPKGLRKLALVYLFQWFAMNVYWQFVAATAADAVWGTHAPSSNAFKEATAWTGVINGTYNVVTFCCAFGLVSLAHKIGPKAVHCACLLVAAVGLFMFPAMTTKEMLLIPIIGLGVAWASIMGVPYIMAVRMIPKERYGVYMGIINMMIVVPQLLQTLSFGAIYKHLLGAQPAAAMRFAAILLAVAALAMLWINEKKDGATDLTA
ncbi:sugar transporter [Actinomyces sp. HMSC06A08]|uniref:MFS transporter n=2 Tax=Winkia neuii TaxID=33007 RepID=A0A2I1INC1_9ACTO|nr:transporter, major facilitator family protein [Winkia neuii]OFJ68460.1 sugar transporter [Actinomyces sp. HMSC064C12]OFK00633.1 sugar transporter [Actinomyces sp. HMSC072A03]OFT56848.1 sugar transporter [Actinomyces sp. HMSC06A08]PKY72592.1 MFS transporter [Winkia neuii]